MAETRQACYYRYIIFPDEQESFALDKLQKIIKSGWDYTSGIGAFSAGKAAAKKMDPLTKETNP